VSKQKACLPSAALLQQQAEWLAPMRNRLLRRIGIAHRSNVLDLGAGYGKVSAELARRSSGQVVALDMQQHPLLQASDQADGSIGAVCAEGARLPFADGAFDMVFCQFVLMWVAALHEAIREIRRVLRAGGVLLAFEPDYGGMIEHPPAIATRDIWITALHRAGANPFIGRLLPGLLEAQGLHVRVDMLPQLLPPAQERFELLRGLPLTRREHFLLRRIEQYDARMEKQGNWSRLVHLPFILVTADVTGD